MNMDVRERFELLLEKRSDGALSDIERDELAMLAREHEELGELLALDERIDERLRAQFGAPTTPRALPDVARPVAKIGGWRHYAALAAMIAVATTVGVAAVMYVGLRPGTTNRGPAYALHTEMDATALLARLEARGFEPDWVCETEAQFAAAVEEDLGVPIAMAFDDPELSILGWTYLRRVREGEDRSKRDLLLMLRDASGEEILVAMGREGADDGRSLAASGETMSELRVFRGELDGVVLYEITPHDEPRVVEKLRVYRP